jgi:uncharacterized protein
VASQYDNRRFGSGNKVLHNVVGGAFGVLEGNAEALRLGVFLQAPQAPIDEIIARHALVEQLVDNGWLHLFRLDDREGSIHRRFPGQGWVGCAPPDG